MSEQITIQGMERRKYAVGKEGYENLKRIFQYDGLALKNGLGYFTEGRDALGNSMKIYSSGRESQTLIFITDLVEINNMLVGIGSRNEYAIDRTKDLVEEIIRFELEEIE